MLTMAKGCSVAMFKDGSVTCSAADKPLPGKLFIESVQEGLEVRSQEDMTFFPHMNILYEKKKKKTECQKKQKCQEDFYPVFHSTV